MRTIKVKELRPGDILAMPVNLPRSGITLLAEGTAITPKHIEYLLQYRLGNEECYLMETGEAGDDRHSTEKQAILASFRTDIMQGIENAALKETLVNTCTALGSLEQDFREGRELSLEPVKDASQQLLTQVMENNAVMLQLAALKAINEYTFSHSVNVAIYAVTFGRILGNNRETLQELALAGLLHDIGKLSVPLEIIDKPGELTGEEYNQVKRHTYEGYKQLVKRTGVSNDVLQAVLQHHEKLNGSGYPLQLKSSKIHPWARMLAIIDIYDALTSKRCYRDAVLPHETADYLMGMASQGELDLKMLNLYLKNIPLYPQGCEVSLSSGEQGKVVETPLGVPLRPVVEVTSLYGGKKAGGTGAAASKPEVRRKRLELSSNPTVFITGIVSR